MRGRGRPTSWRVQRRRQDRVRGACLTIVVLACLLPLVWTLLASLGITPDTTTRPPTFHLPPTLAAYRELGVAVPNVMYTLLQSTALAVLATTLTIGVAFPAAYSFTRWRQRPQFLLESFLVLASLPVMAYILPLADTMRRLGLTDTFVGVALAEAAVFAPLAVYLLAGYLALDEREQEEAAHLDGATLFRVLWAVVLPAAAPSVAATAVIVFVLNWNLFLLPLVLTAHRVTTISVALSDFFTFERELEWPTAAAALVVALLPLVVVVAAAHRLLAQFRLAPRDEGPRQD